jgi:tellurite resistance protein
MKRLSKDDRLNLMRFVCSFAWADFEIQDEERSYVARLVRQLELDAEEQKLVNEWLKVPPPAEEVDPTRIPKAHREIFLNAVRAVVMADGKLDPDEEENLNLFQELLGFSGE